MADETFGHLIRERMLAYDQTNEKYEVAIDGGYFRAVYAHTDSCIIIADRMRTEFQYINLSRVQSVTLRKVQPLVR